MCAKQPRPASSFTALASQLIYVSFYLGSEALLRCQRHCAASPPAPPASRRSAAHPPPAPPASRGSAATPPPAQPASRGSVAPSPLRRLSAVTMAASRSGEDGVRRTSRSFQSDSRRSLRRAEVRAETLYRQCACPPWEAHRCGGTAPLPAEVAAALRTHRDTLAATEAASAVLEQAEVPPPRRAAPPRRSRSPRRRAAPPAPPKDRVCTVYFLHNLPKPPLPPGGEKSDTIQHETQETAPPAATSKARAHQKPKAMRSASHTYSHRHQQRGHS